MKDDKIKARKRPDRKHAEVSTMNPNEGFVEEIRETGATVVRLDRSRFVITRSALPDQARVGDFITQTNQKTFQIDPERTEKRRQELRRMTDSCMQ